MCLCLVSVCECIICPSKKRMCGLECAAGHFSVPLHVQLTENHIHDNDKLSHKKPEYSTKA